MRCRRRCPAWRRRRRSSRWCRWEHRRRAGPSCWRTVGWALRPAGWMPREFLPAKRVALPRERLLPVRSSSNPQGWSPMAWSQGWSRKARAAARRLRWQAETLQAGRRERSGFQDASGFLRRGAAACKRTHPHTLLDVVCAILLLFVRTGPGRREGECAAAIGAWPSCGRAHQVL